MKEYKTFKFKSKEQQIHNLDFLISERELIYRGLTYRSFKYYNECLNLTINLLNYLGLTAIDILKIFL